MKTFQSVLMVACLAVGTTTAYNNANANANANNANAPSRRAFFQKAATTAAVASCAILLPVQSAQAALDACPPKSSNCIRTTWTPPAGTSKAKMVEQVEAVLQAYPQAGQNGVDLGGWEIVEGGFDRGTARVEYKSGIGNFAKFLNGNKPFVDDLKIEIDKAVELRSASRVGDSDLDVNRKRLVYLTNAIKAMGWEAMEPKY